MSCEDQAFHETTVCETWSCAKANDYVKPTLVKRGKYWCCPKCGASYGECPHPSLKEQA